LARRAQVVCGTDMLDWDALVRGLETGLTSGFFETRTLGLVSSSNFGNILALARAREPVGLEGRPAERLLHLLYSHHTRDATDPVDKVYSLLGLVGGGVTDLGKEPDYRQPYTVTYKAVAVALLENSSNLDVLGMCTEAESIAKSGKLPSWVADWSTTRTKMVLLTIINVETSQPAHATMSSSTVLRFSADHMHLLLSGYVIDSVVETSDTMSLLENETNWFRDDDMPPDVIVEDHLPDDPSLWQSFRSFFRKDLQEFVLWQKAAIAYQWRELIRIVETMTCFVRWETFAGVHGIKQPRDRKPADIRISTYWKTLCAGNRLTSEEDGDTPDAQTEAAFWEWHNSLAPTRNLLRLRANAVSSSAYKSAAFLGYLQKTWSAYSKFNDVLDHAYNRRLAKTSSGRLALVPGDAQAGDVIVLCKGGSVPLCLRRADETVFGLLGEAYVHDIMDGRAFDEARCEAIAIR